jgi:hypothetical protein
LEAQHPGIYISGFFASVIEEDQFRVSVTSTKGETFTAKRLILAAGSVSSTLLLNLNDLLPKVVKLRETQVTLLPLLVKKSQSFEDSGFVLSKGFLHVRDNTGLQTDLSVQIIGYNLEFVDRLIESKPFLRFLPKTFLNWISKHLAVALVYQPMEKSGEVIISKENSQITIDTNDGQLVNLGDLNSWPRLKASLKLLDLYPVLKFAQVLPTGLSYHLGALSFPSGERIYDRLGRISETSRIHVVDGSSLDKVFPGSITNTLMANAVRICDEMDFN